MIQENDLPSIIFTPEAIKKQSNIGLFASDELFPACDLYPENFYQLYFELNGVSSLDIFGMSPHGDEDIISKIKAIRNVTIYVYEKNKNKETIIWAKKIPTAHLRDSNEFLS